MTSLDAALSLAREGFPVFPLAPGSKAPATPNGFKDASRNPATIRQMWSDPSYGVAVATGHGLAVLDFDVPEAHGEDSDGLRTLARLIKEHGKIPRTPQVKTPGGGRHLWMLADRETTSRSGIAPGLDLKAKGGYVVAPPTRIGDGEYSWVNPITPDGLAPLPDWITSLAPERKSEPIPGIIFDGEGRERHLVSLAGSLRRRGLGEEAILDALRAFNARQIKPPKPDQDLARIARSIARYAPEDAGEGVKAIRPPKDEAVAETKRLSNYPVRVPGRDLVKEEVPEIKTLSLVGQTGFIPVGLATLVASYPKSGKTTLIYRCLLDWIDEGRSVVYLTEEPRYIWNHRLRGGLDIKRPLKQDGLMIIFGRGIAPKDLLKAAFDGDEDIVVVDTLRHLLRFTQETDNSALAREIAPWIEQAEASGKTLIGLHHEIKAGGEHGRGIAGGHALLGIFDQAVEIRRREGNADPRHRVVSAMGRLTTPEEFVYSLEDGDLVALGKTGAVSRDSVRERVLEAVASSPGPMTREEVREAVGSPQPATGAVKDVLQALAGEGKITRAGSGKRGDPYLWSAILPDYVASPEELERLLLED
jgi:hypothetical protein